MKQSSRHGKKRGGIYDTSRNVKQSQVKKKGGIFALIKAKLAGADIPLGNIRSKSITRQFRHRTKKK